MLTLMESLGDLHLHVDVEEAGVLVGDVEGEGVADDGGEDSDVAEPAHDDKLPAFALNVTQLVILFVAARHEHAGDGQEDARGQGRAAGLGPGIP